MFRGRRKVCGNSLESFPTGCLRKGCCCVELLPRSLIWLAIYLIFQWHSHWEGQGMENANCRNRYFLPLCMEKVCQLLLKAAVVFRGRLSCVWECVCVYMCVSERGHCTMNKMTPHVQEWFVLKCWQRRSPWLHSGFWALCLSCPSG